MKEINQSNEVNAEEIAELPSPIFNDRQDDRVTGIERDALEMSERDISRAQTQEVADLTLVETQPGIVMTAATEEVEELQNMTPLKMSKISKILKTFQKLVTVILVLALTIQIILRIMEYCSDQLEYQHDNKTQIWRFVTYSLEHGDWLHLFFNLIMKISMGLYLGIMHRWWNSLGIWLTGVHWGSVLTAIFDQDSKMLVKSAGVYALFLASLVTLTFPGNWLNTDYPALYLGILTIIYVINPIDTHLKGLDGNISHVSHIRGDIRGLSVIIWKLLEKKDRQVA